ncbi:uncharacterized protein LOC134722808 [Mytilus trossulus]|uniref:uncharacterized protein LOC134722808 n=1 Tax=Mytilus trossulus TaxID=6551 RepID=UPI0030062411
MISNAPIFANQPQPVQTDVHISRIRSLRILGGAQIGLGVICVILGIVGVILSNTNSNSNCSYDYLYGYDQYYYCRDSSGIFVLYLICIAFSGWFLLTGCLPLCMTEQRQSSWKCLTVAFLVCNILSAVVFSSTVFSLAIVGSLIQQSVIYIHTAQPGMIHNMPNTRILTGNQYEYDQLWKPEMAGYNGQKPANITNNQQQPSHLQGNQILIPDYHGQQPQPFTMAYQQQNINAQQLVYSPEAAGYTTIQEVDNN